MDFTYFFTYFNVNFTLMSSEFHINLTLFSGLILFGSWGSCLVSWLPLPYIGIANYCDKYD